MKSVPWRRLWRVSAGLIGAASVALAAISAHGMEGQAQQWAAKASHFALLHAAVLLALSLGRGAVGPWLAAGGGLLLLGILLFCGSLTGMALWGWPVTLVTPTGGLCFIIGWLALGLSGITEYSGPEV